MSILIKGMEMPKDGSYWCEINVAGDIALITIHGEDRKSFHLVELPNHGELIDRDVLMKYKRSTYDIDGHELYAVGTGTILRMPVVIPAERNEDPSHPFADSVMMEERNEE